MFYIYSYIYSHRRRPFSGVLFSKPQLKKEKIKYLYYFLLLYFFYNAVIALIESIVWFNLLGIPSFPSICVISYFIDLCEIVRVSDSI